MSPLVSQILTGISILLLTTVFAIVAYLIKRYVDNQDISIQDLKKQNELLLVKIDSETEKLKETLEQKINTEYLETNRTLLKEKKLLLEQIDEKNNFIKARVERRVRHQDCICQSKEVKERFESGDRLFGEIKECLKQLTIQQADGLEGIHQYSLIMSSTMLALCRNFGEGINCEELEALHTLLQRRKIEHIVDKVDK